MKIQFKTNMKSINLDEGLLKTFIKNKYKKTARNFLFDFDWNLIGYFDARDKYYDLENENITQDYIYDYLEKLDEKKFEEQEKYKK